MDKEHNISEKVKDFFKRKLIDCESELAKLKLKRKKIKILYVSIVVISIVISAVTVSLTAIISVPVVVITILSAGSAILTGVSARFNFQHKKFEINRLIEKLHKIQSKLDYGISCNGDLTQKEYQDILREFNLNS